MQSASALLSTDKWQDVTSFIRKATREAFNEGEMVSGPGFKLADIMSATEMGDLKMDTFLNVPKGQYIYWPLTRFEKGQVKPIGELDLHQILYMIDQLICATVCR